MDKKINLEKLKEYVGTDEMFFNHAAFKGDEIEEFDPDSMDIEAALKKYDKLYLELGFFYHDEWDDKGTFIIDDSIKVKVDYDEEDEDEWYVEPNYYEIYEYSVAGYGIYLNKNLEYEYAYSTTEPPAWGHGPGYTTFQDFRDAEDDDEIKKVIFKCLDESDIWD